MSAQTLQDELDREYAPAWKPKPGDKVIGTVVDISEREGNFRAYPIVTLEAENGQRTSVHAFHDVLANELGRLAPKIGDEIGIRYDGKADKGYHRYRVRKVGDSTFNWSKYADDTGSNDSERMDVQPQAPAGPDVPIDTSDLPSKDSDDDGVPF